ncbi:MAG: hypothetical protein WCS20_16065 [Alphaproteobacteria bacterium]
MSGETIDAEIVPEPVEPAQAAAVNKPDIPPVAMAMFDALRSGKADPQALMMNALAGQGDMPPEMAMLMKLFVSDGGNDTATLRDQLREEIREEQVEVFAELSQIAERLLKENQLARERLDALAAGIGACPDCFGEDLLCQTCNGVGRPGSRLPQPAEFNRFVSPACHRVRAELRPPQPHRPWPRSHPTHFADLGTTMQSGE